MIPFANGFTCTGEVSGDGTAPQAWSLQPVANSADYYFYLRVDVSDCDYEGNEEARDAVLSIIQEELGNGFGIAKEDLNVVHISRGSLIQVIKVNAQQIFNKIKRFIVLNPTSSTEDQRASSIASAIRQNMGTAFRRLGKYSVSVCNAALLKREELCQVLNGEIELPVSSYVETPSPEPLPAVNGEVEAPFADRLKESLGMCPIQFSVEGITLVHNTALEQQHKVLVGSDESMLLFHGTRHTNFYNIFEQGFNLKGMTDLGYYGQGYYLTSSIEYSMFYHGGYHDEEFYVGSKYVIIGASVALGRVRLVTDRSQTGLPVRPEYDCNMARVSTGRQGTMQGDPVTDQDDESYDEYCFRDTARILPRYLIELKRVDKLVIWRDKAVFEGENEQIGHKLNEMCSIYCVRTTEDAMKLINIKRTYNQVFVITNGGDDGNGFVGQVRAVGVKSEVLVFASRWGHKDWARKLDEQYPAAKVVSVAVQMSDVYAYIVRNLLLTLTDKMVPVLRVHNLAYEETCRIGNIAREDSLCLLQYLAGAQDIAYSKGREVGVVPFALAGALPALGQSLHVYRVENVTDGSNELGSLSVSLRLVSQVRIQVLVSMTPFPIVTYC
jgi:hypothetical protein